MENILKVKPWGTDQGDFVIIDEKNFDPLFHVLYEENQEAKELESIDEIIIVNSVPPAQLPPITEPKKRGRKRKW
jgi:hypothetical protein